MVDTTTLAAFAYGVLALAGITFALTVLAVVVAFRGDRSTPVTVVRVPRATEIELERVA